MDSLLKVLPTLKDDKSKVDALVRIATAYSRIDVRKGIQAGVEAEALARRLQLAEGYRQFVECAWALLYQQCGIREGVGLL